MGHVRGSRGGKAAATPPEERFLLNIDLFLNQPRLAKVLTNQDEPISF